MSGASLILPLCSDKKKKKEGLPFPIVQSHFPSAVKMGFIKSSKNKKKKKRKMNSVF